MPPSHVTATAQAVQQTEPVDVRKIMAAGAKGDQPNNQVRAL
ncbi:hypothetical protein IWX64_001237 [Arthrobacter sp. CAN_A212]